MLQTIEATQLPIAKIFSDDYILKVPIYQRPYAWKEEQAKDMLEDFLDSIRNLLEIEESTAPYFLGSIVLINDGEKSKKHYYIIDGQQRLTTLTILLSVLRELESDYQQSITKLIYQEADKATKTVDLFRLSLREQDEIFFNNNVQKKEGLKKLLNSPEINPQRLSESQGQIYNNTKYFYNVLSETQSSTRQLLIQFITTHCLLVIITAYNQDAAYRIFSVLNNRGLDLSHTDIFKAEILGNLQDNQQEMYSRMWDEIEKNLRRENFQNLFAHIRMIYRTQKLRGTILKEFYEYVKPKENPKDFMDSVLRPYADAFDIVKSSNYNRDSYNDEINNYLRMLNEIEDTDWIPPAIYYLKHRNGDAKNLIEFLKRLERLAAYHTILSSTTSQRISRYGNVINFMKEIFEITGDKKKSDKDLFESSPLNLTDEEKSKMLSLLEGDIYNRFSPPDRLYILLRLNYEISDEKFFSPPTTITIEHILPQTPDKKSQWLEWYPNEDTRKYWTNRLGNLVLLSRRKNSESSNKDFDDKKSTYFISKNKTTPYPLTTIVIQSKTWTEEILKEHHDRCINLLSHAWELR